MAKGSGAPANHDTLLRLARSMDVPAVATPRVLGFDDLALRRGCRHATLLVDMETGDTVDLLEGRSLLRIAATLRLHRRTLRRRLESDEPPRNRRERPRPGGITSTKLAPLAP